MNHFLPNPLKHPKMTFGVLRIYIRATALKKSEPSIPESRQWYASSSHFTFLKSIFLPFFFISNKVTHEPYPKNPSKVPFVLPSYLSEQKGLRFNIIFLNNTEVRAF